MILQKKKIFSNRGFKYYLKEFSNIFKLIEK